MPVAGVGGGGGGQGHQSCLNWSRKITDLRIFYEYVYIFYLHEKTPMLNYYTLLSFKTILMRYIYFDLAKECWKLKSMYSSSIFRIQCLLYLNIKKCIV